MAKTGTIGWIDLTAADAPALRDFYAGVTGATTEEVPMEGYSDFTVHPAGGGDPIAGICHARGGNAALPAVWLVYFVVDDLDRALREVVQRGGRIVQGARGSSGGRMAVIADPAGAHAALWQAPAA